MKIPQFIEKYGAEIIENGSFLEDKPVALTGRIMMLRE